MKRRIQGFTIIELLVVLAIIGVITVLVFQQVTNARAKQRDQERIQDINVINANLQEMRSGNQGLTEANLTSFTCGNIIGCETLNDPQGGTYRRNPTAGSANSVTDTGIALAPGGPGAITRVCGVLERGTSIAAGNGLEIPRHNTTGQFLYCGTGNF